MSDIAFIGNRDTFWPFEAFGCSVFYASERESASNLVSEAIGGKFKIIFVTEDVYEAAGEEIDALREQAIPTFAVLPSVGGGRGVAMQAIREAVRKAMGAEFI